MPPSIAVYERTIHASLERIWENVLDWEHLPWLHKESFGHVRLFERSRDGWRGEASVVGGAPFELDVALDREARRYHSRTVAGPGAGTDIVTELFPVGERETRIRVDFLVPGIAPEHAERVGAVYVGLYTLLWDQDEAMMRRRQALLDGTLACPTREVLVDGAPAQFATVCPHLGGPLDDAPVDGGCVTCPWHGYRFDVRTGRSTDGHGLRLD